VSLKINIKIGRYEKKLLFNCNPDFDSHQSVVIGPGPDPAVQNGWY
jgi:hypothetical protein